MAKILFAWELGGGLGHVGPFYPIAQLLVASGHELVLAVREPARVVRLYEGLNVAIVQAPQKPRLIPGAISNPKTYPQILHNVGFGDADSCEGIIRSWQTLVRLINPDLVIADHAPGIMLAVSGQDLAISVVGTGFTVPPAMSPLPCFIGGGDAESIDIAHRSAVASEEKLLGAINHVLERCKRDPIDSVGHLFGPHSNPVLTTFHELDHYPQRLGGNYAGPIAYTATHNREANWPHGTGPRVFAYLKSWRGMGHLLDAIRRSHCPAIIVCDGIDIEQLQRIATPNMRFFDRPLPIQAMAEQCDFAILNATHGATSSMLLAGKPILQIPHNLEQHLTASRTIALGAAVGADKDDGLGIVSAFRSIQDETRFATAAQSFKHRHGEFDPLVSVQRIANFLCELVP